MLASCMLHLMFQVMWPPPLIMVSVGRCGSVNLDSLKYGTQHHTQYNLYLTFLIAAATHKLNWFGCNQQLIWQGHVALTGCMEDGVQAQWYSCNIQTRPPPFIIFFPDAVHDQAVIIHHFPVKSYIYACCAVKETNKQCFKQTSVREVVSSWKKMLHCYKVFMSILKSQNVAIRLTYPSNH